MPSCSSCGGFVAIDADACPSCGGKQKYDLDDSQRAELLEKQQAQASMGPIRLAGILLCLGVLWFTAGPIYTAVIGVIWLVIAFLPSSE